MVPVSVRAPTGLGHRTVGGSVGVARTSVEPDGAAVACEVGVGTLAMPARSSIEEVRSTLDHWALGRKWPPKLSKDLCPTRSLKTLMAPGCFALR